MPSTPPKKLEAVVAFLIPAACREHVLGDLHERYRSPRQYAWDALCTVPMVVLGRILRTSRPRMVTMEAAAFFAAYLAAAWQVDGFRFLSEDAGSLRVLAAAMIALTALVVRDAYCAAERLARPITVVEAAAIALVIQLGLGALGVTLVVSRDVAVLGSLIGAALVFGMRMMYPGERSARPLTRSLEEVPERALRFERTVRQRNLREYLAATFVVVSMASFAVREASLSRRLPLVLCCAGASFVACYLYRRGTPARLPAEASGLVSLRFYRGEVERQRALLRTIWSWYLGPLIPGFVAIVMGSASANPGDWPRHLMKLGVFWILLYAVAWLNRREAEHLQREIDSLNAIEREVQ